MTQYYAPQPQPKKKMGGIKIAGIVVGSLILLSAVGSALGDDEPAAVTPEPTVTVTATETPSDPAPEKPKEEKPVKEAEKAEPTPEPSEPEFTREEENAIQTARDYLDFMAFSRSGLIEQLEYEGFPKKVAKKAVDHLDIDWMKQAVKCAEDYLDYSSFSKQGLIEQLIFEGFTEKQARHGAETALG